MSTVTLTIDGSRITVPKGTTVLEAARMAGSFVPTLFHDPELSKPGACRLCVVEIKGARNLPASCVTEAQEGMVVETASPQVIEARKTILELMLDNHPQDCLSCHQAGDCKPRTTPISTMSDPARSAAKPRITTWKTTTSSSSET